MSENDRGLFRAEAVQHYTAAEARGDVLRLSPAWLQSVFWLLAASCVFVLAFVAWVPVSEYASGPVVVRFEGKREVPAPVSGTVASVEVRPRQRVVAGQVLARFVAMQELAELQRFDREFEQLLMRRMRDLGDESARQSLPPLRAQRDLARARLEAWTVRAPEAGVVTDVRIRRGQHLEQGDVVVAIAREDAPASVTALVPGSYRPMLAEGGVLRLELQGFSHAYQELEITEVGEELIGPQEVQRYLGPGLSESLTVQGAVVMVRAHPPSRYFQAGGHRFEYFDGMLGTADIRVRAEPILLLLVPGLRALLPQ